jgi:hypothetical protein
VPLAILVPLMILVPTLGYPFEDDLSYRPFSSSTSTPTSGSTSRCGATDSRRGLVQPLSWMRRVRTPSVKSQDVPPMMAKS